MAKHPLWQFSISGILAFTSALAGALAARKITHSQSDTRELITGMAILAIVWALSWTILRGLRRSQK